MSYTDGLVREVVGRTLLDSAFMFASPMVGDDRMGLDLCVRIAFLGRENGSIFLATDDPFARSLAANLLGLEPDDEELATAGPAALLELANILAGLLLEAAGGGRTSSVLGIPVITDTEPDDVVARGLFVVDDMYRLWVSVALHQGAS